MRFRDPIKKYAKLTANILTSAYKLKVITFKLDEDPLQSQVYFLSFMNSLKLFLSQFKENFLLSMDYPSTRRKDMSDYSKKATCKPFNSYIDEHIQILIDEYPVYGVQAIIILQYQCENMTIVDQIIYNRLFQKLIPK